jgi:integrase
MSRTIERLTPRLIERLRGKPGRYADGQGLYVEISSATGGSYLFRFQVRGRASWCGIGPLNALTLAQARQRAQELRHQKAQGLDPVAEKARQRAALKAERAKLTTFKQAAEDYIATHKPGWAAELHRSWTQGMRDYCFPHIGASLVSAIQPTDIERTLKPIWSTKNETASRLRARIEIVLSAAAVRGLRSGPNPAAWEGCLEHLLPKRAAVAKVEHHAALPYAELPALMIELQSRPEPSARALMFTILTAARAGETLNAPWSEFDVAANCWTIPADRMKMDREHRVPLSDAAIAILGEPGQPNDSAFPIGKNVMSVLLGKLRPIVTVHGFRATFKTWASEETDFAPEIAEAALAHVRGNAVERSYNRGDLFDKRRQLTNDWATFCAVG